MCVEIYTKEPPFSCRIMYLWYIVILILSPVKEIVHLKWGLIGDVVGFFIPPLGGYESLTHLYLMKFMISRRVLNVTLHSHRQDG